MAEENKVERFRLHKAFTAYAEDRTKKGYEAFLAEFIECAKEGRHTMVPFRAAPGGVMEIAHFHQEPYGSFLVLCSTPEELDDCPFDSTAIMTLSSAVERAVADDEIAGICLNPGNPDRCFIHKIDLCRIRKELL